MGVKMSTPETLATLDKLIAASSQEKKKLTKLIAAGYKVSFGLFQIIITSPGGSTHQKILPKMYSQLPNATANEKALAVEKISEAIESAFVEMAQGGGAPAAAESVVVDDGVPAPKPPVKTSTKPPAFATVSAPIKELAAAEAAKGTDPAAAIPVAAVLPLKDAKALGQKVQGSGAGAIYRACAIGKVNFGCKMSSTTLSLRVEPKAKLTPAEQATLKGIGFSDQGPHMSIHVTLGKVPALRTLGALLFSSGLLFNQVATTDAQLNA